MKKQNLQNGTKLNKKELKTITGGLMQCRDPKTNGCRIISMGCAEPECRPELIP
ncbi:bacteriocin [Chryseobacterium daecheongense]|nr:bacteriocin [Chryseobacterium daecheongense]